MKRIALLSMCGVLLATTLGAQNFVIKKVKQVVVNNKDQCLDAMGNLVKKIPSTISSLSSTQLRVMQELEKEFDAKKSTLSDASNAQLKKYRDAIITVEQKLAELERACKKLHTLM